MRKGGKEERRESVQLHTSVLLVMLAFVGMFESLDYSADLNFFEFVHVCWVACCAADVFAACVFAHNVLCILVQSRTN